MYKSEISKKTLFCSLYICKMNKILIAICVCCVFTQHSFSQVKIDTDRPDQTESAVLTPKGFFQAEVGSSENNIRRAIATAEAVAPCVMWIDEIEKGLSGVQSSGATDGGTTSRIFSTILTWMQEKTQPVFVVATANDISQLPPELLRKGRFDEMFFVDLPSEEDSQKPDNFGLDKLAKESKGFNGAEIEECVKEAMFSAYTENPNEPKLQIVHLLNAIKDTVPLSKTMKDQIEFLRKWANSRAKQAGQLNNEDLKSIEEIPLTKVEKELNRSFD